MTRRIGIFNAQKLFECAKEPNRECATAPVLKTLGEFRGVLRGTSHDHSAVWAAYQTLKTNIDVHVESGHFRKELGTVASRTAARHVRKWKCIVHLDYRARPLGAISPC